MVAPIIGTLVLASVLGTSAMAQRRGGFGGGGGRSAQIPIVPNAAYDGRLYQLPYRSLGRIARTRQHDHTR